MSIMKRLFCIVLCFFLCISSSACQVKEQVSAYGDDYEDGYNYGYDRGYEQGLYDGIDEAREDLAREAWSRYQDMEGQTTQARGLHPEEAIIVLNDYLDGEYVTNDELETAIRSITYFYYHAWDVINEIEDMDVYLD